jgi:membrane peptidoglycan carboxypeptidase
MDGRVSNVGNVVSLLGAFVATAMVIGLLAAGLLIPAVGATGTAANSANSGVEAFDNLPSEFTSTPLSQQSRILDAEGNVIATPQDENRIIVDLKDIAPIMQKAQIAIAAGSTSTAASTRAASAERWSRICGATTPRARPR